MTSTVFEQPSRKIVATLPEWVDTVVDWRASYATDEAKMRLAIAVATHNVLQRTGGPFGAAIFERQSGALVSVGMNSVVRLHNSTLHAEMLAIMLAEQRIGSYTLHGDVEHDLVTSCDPCAMCLGAILWSGVRRVITGAGRDDAAAIDFDEGPVFPESYAYLEARGIAITRGLLRAEAAAVIELYRKQGGPIYNA
jgi:tRNA(Arg) A34 adenosine deaminase TadA